MGEKRILRETASVHELDERHVQDRLDLVRRVVGDGRWRNKGLSKFNRVAEIMSVLFAPEKHIIGVAIIHNLSEIVRMVNMCLNADERICVRTFERYLKGENVGKWADADLARMFSEAYQLALYEQKQRLFTLMAEDQPGGWQRWTWILERRFDEWNLRNKVVNETPDLKRLVLKVKAD